MHFAGINLSKKDSKSWNLLHAKMYPRSLPSEVLLKGNNAKQSNHACRRCSDAFIRCLWSRLAIAFSKLTMETLEQGVKYVIGVALVSLLLTLNIFHTLL